MRTLIVNPDWDALLFWRDEQSQLAVDDVQLPISDSLRAQLDSFGALHSELYFGEGGKPSDLDVRLLDDKGLVVWSELRRELEGSYRVLFFSHEFMEAFERIEDFTAARQTPKPKKGVSLLLPLLIAMLGLACLAAWLVPARVASGPSKTAKIVNNLRQIEIMKVMWASDHGVTDSVRISEHDLAPYAYGYSSNGLVRPVAGERYIIHRLGVGPEALLTLPCGRLPAGTVIRLDPDSNRVFRVFLPNQQGRANGSQPIRSVTNSTSVAAGSRRSP